MIADPLWCCVMLLCGLLWVFCGSFVVLCGPLWVLCGSFVVLCGPLRSFVVLCGPLRYLVIPFRNCLDRMMMHAKMLSQILFP